MIICCFASFLFDVFPRKENDTFKIPKKVQLKSRKMFDTVKFLTKIYILLLPEEQFSLSKLEKCGLLVDLEVK